MLEVILSFTIQFLWYSENLTFSILDLYLSSTTSKRAMLCRLNDRPYLMLAFLEGLSVVGRLSFHVRDGIEYMKKQNFGIGYFDNSSSGFFSNQVVDWRIVAAHFLQNWAVIICSIHHVVKANLFSKFLYSL